MIAIQDALNRDLGRNLDCGVLDSVTLEMSKSEWVSRNELLKRWVIEGVVGAKTLKTMRRGRGRRERRWRGAKALL